MNNDTEKQLDELFTAVGGISNKFEDLKAIIDGEKIEKPSEETQTEELSADLISTVNSDRALPDELAREDNVLISTVNSDQALPDEHAKVEEVPISTVNADVIHENILNEEDPISSHVSDNIVKE